MDSLVSVLYNIVHCPGCGDSIWLRSKDFILLNNERICFHTCDACGHKIKIMEGK